MEEQIFNANDRPWVETGEGRTKVLLGEKFSKSGRFRLFNLKPGEEFNTHEHHFTQCMYFTSGQGWVSVDDQEQQIVPGLTVIVLPQQCHAMKNTGNDEINIVVFESTETNPQDTPFVDF